ncbi:pyridoxamine 5'-phosphate oxidase [Gilvibacter sp.]|uniref:pyridoxamine 5'-phosphate oxidase n=1 Tax=Gilvibacter sp. TaxID=2729997 RepID=UPI0025C3EA03|nr:pyridoxamine 5'-phosphate oxidase [Gilvibacter sp.]NQX78893.1 pyridoxamine 5'-phosphate oxidase [Gilvibacter sp.]
MDQELYNFRKSYEKGALDKTSVDPNPLQQFRTWFHQVQEAGGIEEVNAMTVTTLSLDGYPKGRVVLLKKYNEHGFYFYTNYHSEKGQAILANSKVSLAFFWPTLERQVLIKGNASKTTRVDTENYWDSRPLGSRLGAIVSDQSKEIPNREVLEDRLKKLESTFSENDTVPCPDHWGGILVAPVEIEFWQGRPNRLHDRILYRLQDDGDWDIVRLSP